MNPSCAEHIPFSRNIWSCWHSNQENWCVAGVFWSAKWPCKLVQCCWCSLVIEVTLSTCTNWTVLFSYLISVSNQHPKIGLSLSLVQWIIHICLCIYSYMHVVCIIHTVYGIFLYSSFTQIMFKPRSFKLLIKHLEYLPLNNYASGSKTICRTIYCYLLLHSH